MFCLAVCTFARPRIGRPIVPSSVPSPLGAAPDVNVVFDHEEGTDQPHGESTWFSRPCAASGDYKRMPLVSFKVSPHDWTFNITRVRHFCTVSAAQAEAMYKPKSSSHRCLWCALCVKLKKSRIKNQSRPLFHKLNLFCCSFHLCPTMMTTSSGAICLYMASRERGLQKLHSFAAPTLFPRRDHLRLAMRAD